MLYQTQGKPKKLIKADIGSPFNFKHVTHVGWDNTKAFMLSTEDRALEPFADKDGIIENEEQDVRTPNATDDSIATKKTEKVSVAPITESVATSLDF